MSNPEAETFAGFVCGSGLRFGSPLPVRVYENAAEVSVFLLHRELVNFEGLFLLRCFSHSVNIQDGFSLSSQVFLCGRDAFDAKIVVQNWIVTFNYTKVIWRSLENF